MMQKLYREVTSYKVPGVKNVKWKVDGENFLHSFARMKFIFCNNALQDVCLCGSVG